MTHRTSTTSSAHSSTVRKGGGPRGEIEEQILEGNLRATLLNYARWRDRAGHQLVYRPIDAINGSFSGRVAYTRMFQNDEFLDPTNPGRADQLLLELNYPRDAVNGNFSVKSGAFTLGYQIRYIGEAVLNVTRTPIRSRSPAAERRLCRGHTPMCSTMTSAASLR